MTCSDVGSGRPNQTAGEPRDGWPKPVEREPRRLCPDKPSEPRREDDETGGELRQGRLEARGKPAKDEHGSIEGARRFIRKHPIGVAIGAVIFLVAVVAGILYWLHARNYESTDDAFIDGRPVSISPEVTGNIVAVPVTDNQVVKAGDVLARIDDRDYRAAVANAAGADRAGRGRRSTNGNAQIGAQQSQIEQTKRQVTEAQAALELRAGREQALPGSRPDGRRNRAAGPAGGLRSAPAAGPIRCRAGRAASGREADQRVCGRRSRNAVAQREQAKAQKAQAEANLSRTVLHATIDGRVTRLTGAVGQVATAQSALMILVPLDVWVTANFKETQLELMKVGQPVTIEVDAYSRTFAGHVDSIQAGSGTAFSLLPAENATGNYVKVVQRIPVKITFDQRPDVLLGPGMSVVPTVKVR